jgi:hypothetical protein
MLWRQVAPAMELLQDRIPKMSLGVAAAALYARASSSLLRSGLPSLVTVPPLFPFVAGHCAPAIQRRPCHSRPGGDQTAEGSHGSGSGAAGRSTMGSGRCQRRPGMGGGTLAPLPIERVRLFDGMIVWQCDLREG